MGETLRTARERHGLSLDVISQRTKIGIPALRAIEANDIQSLPTGIFLRGFIRAYAREVGLDTEDTVNRYIAQFEPQATAVDSISADEPIEQSPGEISQSQHLEESLREVSILGVLATVVVSLGLIAYMTLRPARTSTGPTVTSAAVAGPVVSPPAAASTDNPAPANVVSETAAPDGTVPENTTPTTAPLQSAASVSKPAEAATRGSEESVIASSGDTAAIQEAVALQSGDAGAQQDPPALQSSNTIDLTIETVGPCWVEVVVDGQTVVYALMQEGERQSIPRGNDVVLRVGDPAAFTFSINGMPGKSLGQPGTASTVHITGDNYEEFTAAAP